MDGSDGRNGGGEPMEALHIALGSMLGGFAGSVLADVVADLIAGRIERRRKGRPTPTFYNRT